MRPKLLLCLGLVLGSNLLAAGQIFSNFDQTDPNNVYNTAPTVSIDPSVAVGFIVPTAPDGFSYTLSDFTVAVTDSQGSSMQAALYTTDSSSGTPLPGTAIESFNNVALDANNPLTMVNSLTNPTLTSGAEYWIVLSDPTSSGGLNWFTSGNLFEQSGDAISTFDADTESFDWQWNPGYQEGALQVDANLVATTTPEPATFALFGAGLLALGWKRRRA